MKAADRVLRILVAKNEQRPWPFPSTWRPSPKAEPWTIEAEKATLIDGIDYALEGWSGQAGEPYGIGVQRKNSLDEIAGNMKVRTVESGGIRNLFTSECMRLSLCTRPILVICQPREGGLAWSQMNPDAVLGQIDAAVQEYRLIHHFADGETAGMEYALRAFRYFKESLPQFWTAGHVRDAAKEPLAGFSVSGKAGLLCRVGELERKLGMIMDAGLPARIQLAEEREAEAAP